MKNLSLSIHSMSLQHKVRTNQNRAWGVVITHRQVLLLLSLILRISYISSRQKLFVGQNPHGGARSSSWFTESQCAGEQESWRWQDLIIWWLCGTAVPCSSDTTLESFILKKKKNLWIFWPAKASSQLCFYPHEVSLRVSVYLIFSVSLSLALSSCLSSYFPFSNVPQSY